ncbi:hypothetical protein Ppb6_02025 [Photorhabdus australis subsp. thailandensis]|uniref:Uncharacterized protein n=1 Tax=Photorhabdus australis subsp. thailandensis TaxID=2805096 RepID=A0A1C0U458_9GAMM|nr:hypothetical protein Ppb6_02025 [Photorhabdus australis subsp. thailandensis]
MCSLFLIYVFLISEMGNNLITVKFVNNINVLCHAMLF